MDEGRKKYLEEKARMIRSHLLVAIGSSGQGHVGGCLSIADVAAVLYFYAMKIDPKQPKLEGRDRLVLSKGHAGPTIYAALALAGYFDLDLLKTLNQPHTSLPSHCDMHKTPGIDMTAGSLGQGLSCGVGIAKAAKITKGKEYIYVIIGDGESQEGAIWEASMSASHYNLDNLIVFLDHNKLQIDGTVEEVMSLLDPAKKWQAFGFNTFRIDGHDVGAICDAIDAAKRMSNTKPTMIILDTIKGKGVSFIEAEGASNHSMALNSEQVEKALAEINGEG
jgi:transketolase